MRISFIAPWIFHVELVLYELLKITGGLCAHIYTYVYERVCMCFCSSIILAIICELKMISHICITIVDTSEPVIIFLLVRQEKRK